MAIATILPTGRTAFYDANGVPLVSGYVYFYIPNTSTPKNTWQDAGEMTLNTNPVRLDSIGSALIYGSGQYRMVVKDVDLNTIYDALTQDILGLFSPQTSPTNGSALVSFLYPGGVARSLYAKFSEATIDVKDFGAVGDGATDDTAAIQNASAAAINANVDLYYPAGTYIVSNINRGTSGYGKQPNWIGDGKKQSVIKRKAGSTGEIVTIGSAAATNFMTMNVTGIGFDSNSTTSGNYGIQMYDVVRTAFTDCAFINADRGVFSNGGIDILFENCDFLNNTRGANINSFSSAAGGGYPNNITFRNCRISDNTSRGIFFDNGRMLVVDNCDFENNGTNAVTTDAAIRVGSNVGSEISNSLAVGLLLTNSWFESNAGAGSVECLSGTNKVKTSYFFANSNTTYDAYFDTCNYTVESCVFDTTNAVNIFEEATIVVGNNIVDVSAATFTVDDAKTKKNYAPYSALIYQTAPQTITDATPTDLTWGAAAKNDLTMWTIGDPTKLVVPAGVKAVRVAGAIQYAAMSVADKFLKLNLQKNGAATYYGVPSQTTSTNAGSSAIYSISITSPVLLVTPGDYFQLNTVQFTSASQATNQASTAYTTWFSMEIIE